jgi:hypothetical protein
MPFTSHPQDFVNRIASAAVLAMVALAPLVAFTIRGGTTADNYVDRRTETVVCTATGGLASYQYCQWREPSNNAGSGAVITGLYHLVGNSPKAVRVDWTIGDSATLSGSLAVTNLTDVVTATGAVFQYSTGGLVIDEGNYLRGITLTDPLASHTASVLIEYVSRLAYD